MFLIFYIKYGMFLARTYIFIDFTKYNDWSIWKVAESINYYYYYRAYVYSEQLKEATSFPIRRKNSKYFIQLYLK